METIRIGVFGLGHYGLARLRLLQRVKGYRITAIGDPIPGTHERALAELEDHDGLLTYSRYEDLLADPNVDAVSLVMRCKEQGAMAAKAMEAGKHVCAAVPAAHTMEDCWRIVTAQEKSRLVYLLAEQHRYAGFIEAWCDLVKRGQLGRVAYCEGEYIGYKGRHRYYQDWETGEFVYPEDVANHRDVRRNWIHLMENIHYLPHNLSPILKVLDDRVVEVTGMGTNAPSYTHPEFDKQDIQAALMKTAKGTLMRMVCSFTLPTPSQTEDITYRIIGTRGSVESARSRNERPKLWFADSQMHDRANVDWRFQRTDASQEALASGHRSMDYYVQTAFRDAVLGVKPLEFDVYRAVDTAAPAILAANSIREGSTLMEVPDFRPNALRPAGQMPETI